MLYHGGGQVVPVGLHAAFVGLWERRGARPKKLPAWSQGMLCCEALHVRMMQHIMLWSATL